MVRDLYLDWIPQWDKNNENPKHSSVPESDFRQNTLGLLSDIIFSHAMYADDAIVRYKSPTKLSSSGKNIPIYRRTTFEAVFTGYDRRSMRESTFSRDVLGTFIEKFDDFLGRMEPKDPVNFLPKYPKSFYSALFLLCLDTISFPKAYLFRVRFAVAGQGGAFLSDASRALFFVWKQIYTDRIDSTTANDFETFLKELLWRDDQPSTAMMIFVYSLAKSLYDYGSLGDPTNDHLIGTIAPNGYRYFSCVPVLEIPEVDDPAIETQSQIWGQFNKLVFFNDNKSVDLRRSTYEQDDAEFKETVVSVEARRSTNQQLQSFVRRAMTGINDPDEYFEWMTISHAIINPPNFEANWKLGNVRELVNSFVHDSKSPEPSSQIVFFVGPYGTSKTSIAQYIFHRIVEANQNHDWRILSYDSKTKKFSFGWVSRDQTIKSFRLNELSRFVDDETIKNMSLDLPENSNLTINLSELNASSVGSTINSLKAMELLLREIKEKAQPRKLIIFVAAQAYQLARNLEVFFKARPDLSMGRARLDRIWIIRGDIAQSLPVESRRGESRRAYLRELLRRLTGVKFDAEDPYFQRILDKVLMRLDKKAGLYALKIIEMNMSLSKRHSADAARIQRLLQTYGKLVSTPTGNQGAEIRLWDALDGSLLELGLGSLQTTTICLNNGLIRQTIEMLVNEVLLDLQEWAIIEDLSPSPKGENYHFVENMTRSSIYDLLPVPGFDFKRLIDFDKFKAEKGDSDMITKISSSPSASSLKDWSQTYSNYKSFYETLLTSVDKSLVSAGCRYRSANENSTFDLGFVKEVGSAKQRKELHYFVDVTTKDQKRDKGKPKSGIATLTLRLYMPNDGVIPIKRSIWLIKLLTDEKTILDYLNFSTGTPMACPATAIICDLHFPSGGQNLEATSAIDITYFVTNVAAARAAIETKIADIKKGTKIFEQRPTKEFQQLSCEFTESASLAQAEVLETAPLVAPQTGLISGVPLS